MFRSFRYYNFRIWIAGILISNLGVWMQRTAQDWIVLTELTNHNATAVGLTNALQFAPQLVLVGLTGTLADRVDRRKLLAITQSSMAVLAVILAVLALGGWLEMWMMYALALGLGLANAFDIPARQSFVAQLVEKQDLANAASLNSAGFNLARLIGPGVAGLLIALIGSGWLFALNAASFIAVLMALFALRPAEIITVTRSADETGKFREGLQYLRGRPDIIAVTLAMFVFGGFGYTLPISTSTMAYVEFHESATVFGIMGSAVAVGSLLGALLIARMTVVRLRHLALASLGFGIASFTAAVMPTTWTFIGALVALGLTMLLLMSGANAYVQVSTPSQYLGRVLAIYSAAFVGAIPVGAIPVGWVADTFGPRWTLIVSAGSGFFAAAMIIGYAIWAGVRLGRHPDQPWRIRVTTPERARAVVEAGEPGVSA